jgi:hypothetical protein
MYRAVMVVMVSGYTFCGIVAGGNLPYGPVLKPTLAAERWLASAPASGGRDRPLVGFDTCKAPSLRTMRVWRARFSVAGIYIGGENRACGYGNLSRSWVRTVKAMGWSLLPTYVGPQPPCDSYPGRIRPRQAAAQGRAAADGAIADLTMLGISKGSPVYYDMEAYNRAKSRCVTAVLTFLDAWTRRLNARGYVSGVYSSADSAIADLQSASRIDGHRLAKPRCVWIAKWDHRKNLARSLWPPGDRSKQFTGMHWVKVDGIKLFIDSDLVNGPVVSDRPRTRHPARKHHGGHHS